MSYPDLIGVGTYSWSNEGAYYSYNATATTTNNVSNELIYSWLGHAYQTFHFPVHDIKVNTSTNAWSDGSSSGEPSQFGSDSNNNVELKNSGGTVLFRFAPPASSTWGGGGHMWDSARKSRVW